MKTVYSVVELNQNNNEKENEEITSEYFGEDREGAVGFLHSHLPLVKNAYKDWCYEQGINNHVWTKGEKTHKLYLKVLEID